ncbi:MAG: rRNA maturation RNase YbeY [Beijerinckiaceae bacterium]|nr:rRNA maturation RNase YbeY [Beijerinckiaceae bacterium]
MVVDEPRWSQKFEPELLVRVVVPKVIEIANPELHPEAEVCFSFSNDKRVQELNALWRSKDTPTNVLSFPASNGDDLRASPLLGDVIMAYETIDREAGEEGKLLVNHAAHMVVHGMLHLIGYDHESDKEALEMETLESQILTDLGYPDPWSGLNEKKEV